MLVIDSLTGIVKTPQE